MLRPFIAMHAVGAPSGGSGERPVSDATVAKAFLFIRMSLREPPAYRSAK